MNDLGYDRSRVETMIIHISENEKVSRNEARRMLHKYVCEGACDWYRTRSKDAGFDRLDLTEKQRRVIEDVIRQIMKNVEVDEAKWRIHNVLCPGHPRPRPKKKMIK